MGDEQAWEFIGNQRDMQVATIGKDGRPHLTTNWFAIVDNTIVFNSYEKSQKIVNLHKDNRISVLFSSGKYYNELVGVSLTGEAEIIGEHNRKLLLLREITKRNSEYSGQPVTDELISALAIKRTCVEIHVQSMFSWDHSLQ